MKYLIKFEFAKFFRRKKIVIFLIIFSVFIFFFSYFYGKILHLKNGFLIVAQVLNVVFPFTAFISAIFGALSFSSEYEYGTIYTIFSGKISRNQLAMIKLLFLFLLSSIFVSEIIFPSVLSTFFTSKFSGIRTGGYTVVSAKHLWMIFLVEVPFVIASLFVFAIIGFGAAVIFRYSAGSIIFSLIVTFLINIFTVIPEINKYIFTTYIYYAIDYFSKAAQGMLMPKSWIFKSIVIHILYMAIFSVVSFKIFQMRRDL